MVSSDGLIWLGSASLLRTYKVKQITVRAKSGSISMYVHVPVVTCCLVQRTGGG